MTSSLSEKSAVTAAPVSPDKAMPNPVTMTSEQHHGLSQKLEEAISQVYTLQAALQEERNRIHQLQEAFALEREAHSCNVNELEKSLMQSRSENERLVALIKRIGASQDTSADINALLVPT